MGINAVCAYTGEDDQTRCDVFWGRVNSCRADRSVAFRVGGAAVALIIVGGGPTSWGWCAVPHHHEHFPGGSCDVQTHPFRRMSSYTSTAAVVAARVCGCMTMDGGPWNALMTCILLHTHTTPVTGPLALSVSRSSYVP